MHNKTKFQPVRFAVKGMLAIATLMIYLVSCNSSNKGSPNPLGPAGPTSPQVARITLSPSVATLDKNGTLKFSATGGTGNYTWTVNDRTLAIINASDGSFTASNTAGTVVVTATDSLGAKGNATIYISTNRSIIVTPADAQVPTGSTQTFTATGTSPFFWTLSNTSLGTIGTTTGIFRAANTVGSATVSVVDSVGSTGSATVTIINTSIIVTPASLTFSQLPSADITYTASGAVGTTFFSLSGSTNGYTGATIDSTTGAVTVSSMPTATHTVQTLIITATDGIRSGTATLKLNVG